MTAPLIDTARVAAERMAEWLRGQMPDRPARVAAATTASQIAESLAPSDTCEGVCNPDRCRNCAAFDAAMDVWERGE